MSNNIIIVSIEGNIGSGKSTLLENLKNYYSGNDSIVFVNEPVEEWEKIKDENGVTMLEKFYSDQKKYSFPFQMMAYISRLNILQNTLRECRTNTVKYANKRVVVITERSLYTDKMVFAKMLYDSGFIEYINYQIYLKWFDTFAKESPIDKIIYVKTDPEICNQRILKRSRNGESNIPLEYLKSCNDYHENMLNKKLDTCVCYNQVVLDGNTNIYENTEKILEWIKEINSFINN